MSGRKTVNGNGTVKTGEEVLITPQAMARALAGHIWGVPDGTGAEFDGQFTGEVYQDCLIVKIKRKSEKQPRQNNG